MVETFLLPVATALWVFPLVVLVVMVPVAVVSYRRRGRAGGWTAVVFYSFLFYLLAAFLQTIIPLPRDGGAYCTAHHYASTPQLRPFEFVDIIRQRARGDWSLTGILHNGVLWSTALNVILLLPLGILLRYTTKLGIVATTAVGFGASLFFELTQLTGLWFIYPCAYRLFSVDDLILNTAGAFVGALLGGPLRRILPELAPKRDLERYADKVTVTRRLFALAADLAGFALLLAFSFGLLRLFDQPTEHQGLPVITVGLVWFVLNPALTGSTLGKRAMLLRVERTNGRRAGPLALLVRYAVLLSPLWLAWLALSVDVWAIADHPERLLILVGIVLSFFVVGVWTPLAVFFSDDHRAPYEQLTRTINVAIVRANPASTSPSP
ncbi:VanZ family protein [Actinocrispum wychmicini]|uniref:VanZ family protein n=1 Tax=Actinocrispum wychmicini TaxID=1213861 RepID=UPI00104B067B|nr:VanZ family protein [Actinocrispum wychmicini]